MSKHTDEDFSKLGPWLNDHLLSRNISPEQLADMVGLSRSSVYFYLQDKTRPSRDSISKICEVLQVPLAEAERLYTIRAHAQDPLRARSISRSR